MSALYTTQARVVGGRAGHAETSDGLLKVDLALPKGASVQVDAAAKEFVAKHGADSLPKVAKMHFRTSGVVLGESTASDGESGAAGMETA